MRYKITYQCISHIGNIRKDNQDNYICDGHFMEINTEPPCVPICGVKSSKGNSLFGVFDGMGGEECGEVASYIAAKDAASLKITKNPIDDLTEFCREANSDICSYVEANRLFSMGTTAAMLAFSSKKITLCNIGDSKVFRFSDGVLEQLSQDHLAMSVFGGKPPLSQNLGISPSELLIEPYFAQGKYKDGDIYLICSDGLTDMVSNDEILGILSAEAHDTAADKLLKKALTNGGKDNITIIVCKIERDFWRFFYHPKSRNKGKFVDDILELG